MGLRNTSVCEANHRATKPILGGGERLGRGKKDET